MDIITPAGWGARVDYDTWPADKTPRERVALHYVGNAVTGASLGVLREKAVCRSVERHHLEVRKWRGAAYGWAVGQSGTVYRMRSHATLGAHAGDYDGDGIPENRETDAVLLLIGGDQEPSSAMLASVQELRTILQTYHRRQQLLIGHREIFEHGTGTKTACPGEPTMGWIRKNRRLATPGGATPILSDPRVSRTVAYAFLTKRGAHPRMVETVPLWWTVAATLGVDPLVGLCLAGHETAWGHYGGRVKPEQHNWGGIKTRDGTGFAAFPDPQTGVLAVIQHLYLYAAGPVPEPVDPRHFPWIGGTVTTVEGLSGTWSEGNQYGQTLVALMGQAQATLPPDGYVDRAAWPAWAAEAIGWAIDRKLMMGEEQADGARRWGPSVMVTRAELATILQRLKGD